MVVPHTGKLRNRKLKWKENKAREIQSHLTTSAPQICILHHRHMFHALYLSNGWREQTKKSNAVTGKRAMVTVTYSEMGKDRECDRLVRHTAHLRGSER